MIGKFGTPCIHVFEGDSGQCILEGRFRVQLIEVRLSRSKFGETVNRNRVI